MPVNKRASLPGASELFRPTKAPGPVTPATPGPNQEPERPENPARPGQQKSSRPMATGRGKHDPKITV